MSVGLHNNHLLAGLPAHDLLQLRHRLAWVDLRAGACLHESGALPAHAYFPVSATVSLTTRLHDGSGVEVAVVGRDGLVGVDAVLGGGPAVGTAVVQGDGMALRLPTAVLRDAARVSAPLLQLLLCHTQRLLMQMAQLSACHRHHRLEQQLCRWLLAHLDRLPGAGLAATHEGIAQLLGVRREGVTKAALGLQRAGLIRYARGQITLLDRAGLAARSCECHLAQRPGAAAAAPAALREAA
jgi:CRP-like cAMP-binding protein